MSLPVIGISPSIAMNEGRHYSNFNYPNAVRKNGGCPVLIPAPQDYDEAWEIMKHIDGYLLAGGPDINPKYFGQYKIYANEGLCPVRDVAEFNLIDCAVKQMKPMLGICRGTQVLNVAFGGDLYQDIPFQIRGSSDPEHPNPHSPGSDWPRQGHNVVIEHPLWKTESNIMRVNSYHHQTVRTLAKGFTVIARDETDHTIEAYYSDKTESRPFILGVQWHPEILHAIEPEHNDIFRVYMDQVRESMVK